MKKNITLLFALYLIGIAKISAFQSSEKDTLFLTCFNDSLILETLDTTNLVIIENRIAPSFELSITDLNCENANGLLAILAFDKLQDFTTTLIDPIGDTIPFSDSLTAFIDKTGLYTAIVVDNTNGCTGQDAILFDNEAENCSLLPPNGRWRNYTSLPSFFQINPFFNYPIERTLTYFFNGDTTIQGQNYNKIYSTKEWVVDLNNPENEYAGAIREVGAKVYFFSKYNTREVLLYDFDMTVGDTLQIEKLQIDFLIPIKVYLQSIDTIIMQDNKSRRRYNFYSLDERNDTIDQPLTSWVEGIGNIGAGGFLDTHLDGRIFSDYIDMRVLEDFGTYLQCFSLEDEVVFQSAYLESCYVNHANQSVAYSPFPTENVKWRTLEIRWQNFPTITQIRTYFIAGDTLINNQWYHKIYSTLAATKPTIVTAEHYEGAFREFSKVVYFQDKEAQSERILYDFNIVVGDSVASIFDDRNLEYKIFVSKIDTIQTMDNKYRKRYELAYNLPQGPRDTIFSIFSYWIEGIGDIRKGFLSFPGTVNIPEEKDKFQCFSEKELVVYKNPRANSCYNDNEIYSLEYAPLVLENATWIMVNSTDDFRTNTYFANKIQGDTIVNQINYKKVYYYELEAKTNSSYQLINQTLVAVFREDIPNRKVYGLFFDRIPAACNSNNQEEVLIFDFSKRIGDRLNESCHALLTGATQDFLSDTITKDTIIENYGQPRRVLFTPRHGNLMEGIGFDRGLFLAPTTFINTEHGHFLIDYCRDINFNCNIITSVSDPLTQTVRIFPNPANTFIQVEFNQLFDGQVELKSIAGQTMYIADFKNDTHEIRVIDFPKGVYFLHLQSESEYFVQKILVL